MQTESDADEYLSVMREKNNLVCHYFHRFVDIDSMGPGLQLLGGQFSNFLLGKVSLEFKLHGMSIFRDIQMATYFGTG